jgi:hypothetical protein
VRDKQIMIHVDHRRFNTLETAVRGRHILNTHYWTIELSFIGSKSQPSSQVCSIYMDRTSPDDTSIQRVKGTMLENPLIYSNKDSQQLAMHQIIVAAQ